MLELLVLSTLMIGPCHGYVFKTVLRGMTVNNNTIYPLLRKMTESGYITAERIEQEGKPAKKVYSITEAGKDRLLSLVKNFDEKKAISSDEFYMRVAYFQFLDKETIAQILDARESALNNNETVGALERTLSAFPDASYDILLLKNFTRSRDIAEKKFVTSLRQKYNIKK